MNKVKAVIFDLDGVLVDATEWHFLALNKALRLFGYTITPDEHKGYYNGLPTKKKLEQLTKEKGLPPSLYNLIYAMKQKYTHEMIYRYCREEFQKVYMLQKLKQKGYRLAICSNSIRFSLEAMADRAGLAPYCEFFVSNEDVKTPKPNPEMYLKAFQRFNLAPRECLIIEDSMHGIEAARASGAFVLEVEGYHAVNYELVNNFLKGIEEDRKC